MSKQKLLERDTLLAQLQGQIAAMKPSFEIGVAIRHRFLEQERVSNAKFHDETDAELRLAIIDKGNAAAQGGNGTVDALLLNSNYMPEEYKQIFNKIYCYDVDDYLTLPMKMRKAVDIHASIFAGVGFHEGLASTP